MKIRRGGGGDAMRFIEAQLISRQPTLYSVSTSGAACPGQSPVSMEVTHDRVKCTVKLTQMQYTEQMAKRFGMLDSNCCGHPPFTFGEIDQY